MMLLRLLRRRNDELAVTTFVCHCEERSDEAVSYSHRAREEIASPDEKTRLAVTKKKDETTRLAMTTWIELRGGPDVQWSLFPERRSGCPWETGYPV